MIEKILKKYDIDGDIVNIESNTSGIINKTYIVTYKNRDGKNKRILLQRINSSVFTEPFKLMKNIEGVTTFLKSKMLKLNDNNHKVLEVIKTKDNKNLCVITTDNGVKEFYRAYNYIEDSISYDCSTSRNIVFNVGKAFGNFQKLLDDYPIFKLEETIKDFHDTQKRYQKLLDDIIIDPDNRVSSVAEEIVFVLKRANIYSTIVDAINRDEIPLRVTHNDTKVNNVMMHKVSGDYLAVVDLDTVMPGSLLYDYGDGIRSTACAAKEDETDLDKVYLDIELFKAYTDGFLSEMADYITQNELNLMAESIRIITLELVIRFLNDYINGNTYFKIDYENHNLDRTRNQIKLVCDIEEKMEFIKNYILESYNKYKNN